MIIQWSMRIYQWSIIFAHHFRVSPNFGQSHSMLSKRCGSGSGECRNWKMSTKCPLSPTTVRWKEHATSELHSHWFVIRVEFQNLVSILFQMLAPREYRLLQSQNPNDMTHLWVQWLALAWGEPQAHDRSGHLLASNLECFDLLWDTTCFFVRPCNRATVAHFPLQFWMDCRIHSESLFEAWRKSSSKAETWGTQSRPNLWESSEKFIQMKQRPLRL